MGGWRVKSNHLGEIAARLPKAIDSGVDETAKEMAAEFKTTLWRDTGVIRDVTVARPQGLLHAEIWIGYNRGKGFYSRFQEWGTVKQAARPIVGPTAHRYEPVLADKVSQKVKEACRV